MGIMRRVFWTALILIFQYNPAEAQNHIIDNPFDNNYLNKYKIITDVYGKNTEQIKQKELYSLLIVFSSNENQCNNLGCKTLILDTSISESNYEVILSNGLFHVSDSFTSNFGNGANILFYRNDSSTIGIKFLDKYRIIE